MIETTMSDLLLKRDPKDCIVFKFDAFIFEGKGHGYYVDLHRCDTPLKMIDWLVHLSGKNWFDATFARQFLNMWERKTGFKCEGLA